MMKYVVSGLMRTGITVPTNLDEKTAISLLHVGISHLPECNRNMVGMLKITTLLRIVRESNQAGNPQRRQLPFKKREGQNN